MNTIRKRLPSPAMLVACVALVVALGGVSYAAGVLPSNSVGTAQLQKKAVTGTKLKKNAVTGIKVKNRTLTAADFKAGQLPAGPQGPKGDKGDPGVQGPKGDKGDPGIGGFKNTVARYSPTVSVAPNSTNYATATCLPGEHATGGGAVTGDGLLIESSNAGGPNSSPSSWNAAVFNSTGATKSFVANVVCATVE